MRHSCWGEETTPRVRRIYIIGIYLSPSARVFIIFPLLLLNADLSVWYPHPIPPISFSNIMVYIEPALFCVLNAVHVCLCKCMSVFICVFFSVCMSWYKHFVVSEELTKRLPPDPVDSDHPGLSWYACLVAPTRGWQKSMKSGRRPRTEGPAGNEWLWWLGPSCLPLQPPLHTPVEILDLALALAYAWTSDLAWVGVGEVSPPGRVWPVSCQGWQEETRGGVYIIEENWKR